MPPSSVRNQGQGQFDDGAHPPEAHLGNGVVRPPSRDSAPLMLSAKRRRHFTAQAREPCFWPPGEPQLDGGATQDEEERYDISQDMQGNLTTWVLPRTRD